MQSVARRRVMHKRSPRLPLSLSMAQGSWILIALSLLLPRGLPETSRLRGTAAAALAMLLFYTPAWSHADDASASEYRIKAASLYNFSRFTNWPDENTAAPAGFNLCVIGENPFGDALDSLSGKVVRNRSLVIHATEQPEDQESCHLVFIGRTEQARTAEILASLVNRPVLTVSDSDGFTEQGGIIELKLVERKVRFEINIDAAERAGLVISSKLLNLATIVHDNNQAITP
jgi:hypothetical protein